MPFGCASLDTMDISPKIIKLPPSGPKPGQSVDAWLARKERAEQRELERLRWQALHKPPPQDHG